MVGGLAVLLSVLVSRTAGSGLGGTSYEICQTTTISMIWDHLV